jgi:hypothetical protein
LRGDQRERWWGEEKATIKDVRFNTSLRSRGLGSNVPRFFRVAIHGEDRSQNKMKAIRRDDQEERTLVDEFISEFELGRLA